MLGEHGEMQPWHGADLQPMNQPRMGPECFASARLSCSRTLRLTVADASNAARMILVLSEAPSRRSEARAKTDQTYQGLFRNLRLRGSAARRPKYWLTSFRQCLSINYPSVTATGGFRRGDNYSWDLEQCKVIPWSHLHLLTCEFVHYHIIG
ncbi:uncharacterized protein LY79DRAFT_372753 [Colletotrichum navitas]|uniref:Uncharacterized protein n=1 Tax=Colletotrichum navitas TaxID=681940 RepID=A0AAD8UYS9_9PEZI|nr:uncharacterized protein LY79DRAFT_372753 [Colletotrichum navitas]KAK1574181.1 hypothetical protein LY79DRAFT_372753 [Colletotrichum navitas]